ncbi:MAG: TrbI/VirB10 family protein [Thiothrix sp.]|uniref:TrbI/VirB10 family protein n=1 Tax=Thiothrix sp. TaxID=1032 RepID=UPI00262984C9|nr:TrbI/VirB10 family protein [Thiothrix sp.]MDD5395001.1 TrbI/VirB10 family protein [Thiothrix sp.]
MSMSVPDAGSAAKRQKLLLFGGGLGVFAVLLFLMWLADPGKPAAETLPTATAKVEQVEAVARKISGEELWTAKADTALQEMRRANEAVVQQMQQVKRENEELNKQLKGQADTVKGLQDAATTASKAAAPAGVLGGPLDAIVPPLPAGAGGNLPALPVGGMAGDGAAAPLPSPLPLEDDSGSIVHVVVDGADDAPVVTDAGDTGQAAPTVKPPGQGLGDNPTAPLVAPQAVAVQQAATGRPLPQKRERPKSKTYIPSGSFFKAQLVASLDAPTGGNAEQNPHPVLLVVTDNAFLPNRFKSKVKECHVLASGYGDISSERVNLRTEKMSCVLKDGTVIDTKLDAYIAGEDGKAGVRGNLVSKQGALIANAMLAGTLGGIGQGLAQAATTVTQTGTGAVTSVSPNQALEFGLTSGSGAAMNKLADYYIKAAEKTFPILEVSAGRDVTVILLSGLDIDAEPVVAMAAGQRATTPIVTADDQAQAGKAIRTGDNTW